jgi:hypothetical protein
MKVDTWVFFEILSRKFKFHSNMTGITGTLYEDQYIYFFMNSRSVLPRIRSVSGKGCRENHNTHLMFNNYFLNLIFYEIMWKNIVASDRPQMTIWRMRIAYCVPKATNTHSQFVIFIACPLQQWLEERASMLR